MGDTTKRERPTMARIRELETSLRTEGYKRERAEQALERLQRERDAAVDARDAALNRYAQLDPEAVAMSSMVGPLEEFAHAVRGGVFGYGQDEQRELDARVAERVAGLLIHVGARFGATLEVRS